MKQGPLIAFVVLCAGMGVVPYFVSEKAWATGVGDIVIVVAGIITVGLIWWETRIRSR
jgi:membrane protein YdbS with pleckstrin-like domain